MTIYKTLPAAFSATSAMTAYSYALAELKGGQWREPRMLTHVIKKINPRLSHTTALIAGWFIHYLVGWSFALVYRQLLIYKEIVPTPVKSLQLGVVTGLVGIAGWLVVKKLYPIQPLHDKRFYGQLLIAHVLFAVVAIRLLRKRGLIPNIPKGYTKYR